MNKRTTAVLFTVSAFIITPVFASAQTQDLSEALKRMDAIIAEMTQLRAEFASLATSVETAQTAPTPAVQGSTSGAVLGNDLQYGSTNDDIARVQRLLATDSEIYPYGVDSGFFGPKTQEAVRRFQSRFNLDTVGVVGPSTKALLEVFMAAYPTEDYPADVLKKPMPTKPSTPTKKPTTMSETSTAKILKSIKLSEDDGEYVVRSYKNNGGRNRDLILYPENFDELVELVAKKLVVSESEVRSLIDEDDTEFGKKKKKKGKDYDEGDAEDALDEADEAIDEARDEIREADDDGDDVDTADELYDEARDEYKKAKNALKDEDYRNAVKNAEDAIELAEEAIDAIGKKSSKDSDDIDVIEVDVRDGEARVKVEYEDDDNDRFTVDDDDKEDIIEEIADELDISEKEVKKLVKFDYGDLEEVLAQRDGGKTRVTVKFESGVKVKLVMDEEGEDDIVEEVADQLDLDEDDVERALDMDF